MSATASGGGVARSGSVAGGAPERATPPSPRRVTRRPVRPISTVSVARMWGGRRRDSAPRGRLGQDQARCRRIACWPPRAKLDFHELIHPIGPAGRRFGMIGVRHKLILLGTLVILVVSS